MLSMFSRLVPSKVYEAWIFFEFDFGQIGVLLQGYIPLSIETFPID